MKRILSILLALVMVIGMLPMTLLTASAATIVTYEKVTSAPTDWSGTYLIVYEDGNGSAYIWTGVDAANTYASATYADGVIAGTTALEACEVTVAAMEDGYSVKAGTYGYMYGTSGSNKTNFNTATEQLNTITMTADGDVEITSNTSVFRFNSSSGQYRFRYYKSASYASQQKVYLYKRVETEVSCDHVGTTTTVSGAKDATCEAAGYTGDTVCSCGVTIATGTEIAALGHSYGEFVVTTEAACISTGSQTKTCATCGDEVTEVIAATGHSYGEDGICTSCSTNQADAISYEEVSVETITAGNYIIAGSRGAVSYPNVYPATGTCSGDWTVIGDTVAVADGVITSDLFTGAQVFVLTGDNTNGFTIGYNNGTEMVYLGVSDYTNNRKLAFSADYSKVLWTLGTADKGGYSLNHAFTDSDNNAANYAISDNSTGTASIRGYKSGATYYGIYLFKEVTGGEVVDPELPVDPADCAHEDSGEAAEIAATCTEPGYTAGVYCNDCESYISGGEVIPALGHTEVADAAVAATCTTAGLTAGSHCSVCNEIIVAQTETEALGHTYVDGACSVCGEAEPAEDGKIVFELGDNGDAAHVDGSSATTYTETVNGYTLTLTASDKMYTGARDLMGNSCVKLGTSSVVGGFSFTVPDNVVEVIILVAKYKAKTSKVNINGTEYTLTNSSDSGTYDEITVDTSTKKTVTFATVSGACRAMVNSITFVCSTDSEADHTCVWDEGTVTKSADCLEEGVMTYSCTVEGCDKIKTEAIAKTGHTMTNGTCSVCGAEYYTLSTTLNNNDSVVIYYPGNKVAMTATASDSNLSGATVTIDDSGLLADSKVAIMQVQYLEGSTTDFYLICDGKYLTSGATGKSLTFADEVSDYAVWYIEIVEGGDNTVYIHSRNAAYNGNSQSIEFYSGFTTYGTTTTDIYKFQLYTKGENDIACEHSWSDWETVTDATCTTAGEQKSVCANCGAEKTEIIAATGHTYVFGDDAVTCTAGDVNVAKSDIGNVPKSADSNVYYVEGVVTFVDGGTVYIQDATGGVALRLASGVSAPAVGTQVEAVGSCSAYNGLIQLQNAEYEAVSTDNTVEAKAITLAELMAAAESNGYLSEKVSLSKVTITEVGTYNATYKNIDYTVSDGTDTIKLYRTPLADEANKLVVGDVINVTAVVSTYNGYQLRVVAETDITLLPPSIELTHISLDPANDALGFKATIYGNLPEGAQVGITMSVEGGLEKTYLVNVSDLKTAGVVSLRLKGIMAYNGGEMKITGTPVIVIGEETTTGTSVETSMKDTIKKVNELTLTDDQKAAVGTYYEKYESVMSTWFAADETNNIVAWIPSTEETTSAE